MAASDGGHHSFWPPLGVASLLQRIFLESLLCQLLIFRARPPIVGIRIDADATARREQPRDLDILGIHELDEILHDDVDTILMEVAVVAEGEEIELQALAFHHLHIGDIADTDLRKVGLTRDGTERGELGAVEPHPVVVLLMLVGEGLQHLRGIIHLIFGLGTQRLETLVFSFHTLYYLDIKDLPHTVVDTLVVRILTLVTLEVLHDPYGHRQSDDLVEGLEEHLPEHELRELGGGHDPSQG